nr:MAG TPA: hypothetical protein [Caudoviricetes sp.]
MQTKSPTLSKFGDFKREVENCIAKHLIFLDCFTILYFIIEWSKKEWKNGKKS